MYRALFLLFLIQGIFSQVVFASTSSTTQININIVIKEPAKCDFSIAGQKTKVFIHPSSNCLIKTGNIQKHLSNVSYQQRIKSENNEFTRVVMIVQ